MAISTQWNILHLKEAGNSDTYSNIDEALGNMLSEINLSSKGQILHDSTSGS